MTPPNKVTRRVFIKRTAATALVCATAMSLLQSDLHAAEDFQVLSCAGPCSGARVGGDESADAGSHRKACSDAGIGGDCHLITDKKCIPDNRQGKSVPVLGGKYHCYPR